MKLVYEDRIGVLQEESIKAYMLENEEIIEKISQKQPCYMDSLGWLEPEEWASDEHLLKIERIAKEVREKAEVFVLIGVGGSNNAARSVIKAIEVEGMPTVYYAGNSISAYSMNQLLKKISGKSVYINVIAKNFETLEPGIGFRVLRSYLRENYGEEANKRIIVTGTPGSHLHQLSEKHDYTFLTFPPNIGGRYSAICDVGLFPMAVGGIDVRMMVQGVKDMQKELLSTTGEENMAYRYAAIRNLLFQKGYRIEMLSSFEPRMSYFAKWWIQLFAESEGKDGKGIYPVASQYSEDLHSVGQFVQDGTHMMFETFLDIVEQDSSVILHPDKVDDRFEYLDGVDFSEINKKAFEATFKAHSQCLPCFRIQIDTINAYSFGQLFYFFEYACYLSGTLLGINPFDQPGVEAYKTYMFKALGK